MIYIVLPAYNEEKNIPGLMNGLEELSAAIGEIKPILVDDGSTDKTAELGRELGKKVGLQVIQHEHNKGLGAGVMTGLTHVCKEAADDDIIIFLDADNSHSVDHVVGMKKLLTEGGNDVVICSRYAEGGKEIGLSLFRKIGSRAVSTALAIIYQVKGARDYTCGFRAYRTSIIRKGFSVYGNDLVSETSFVCMAELLIKLASVGAKVDEYPLVLRYDLKQGESKMNIPKTLRRYAYLVLNHTAKIYKVKKDHS